MSSDIRTSLGEPGSMLARLMVVYRYCESAATPYVLSLHEPPMARYHTHVPVVVICVFDTPAAVHFQETRSANGEEARRRLQQVLGLDNSHSTSA